MKVLLDTHIILWAISNDNRLSQKARNIILADENEIYYSTASVWEVAIKHSIHPEHMPLSGGQLSELCKMSGYEMLSVQDHHVLALETIDGNGTEPKHKDPFDRILIAQAKAENMILITHDAFISQYKEKCIIPV